MEQLSPFEIQVAREEQAIYDEPNPLPAITSEPAPTSNLDDLLLQEQQQAVQGDYPIEYSDHSKLDAHIPQEFTPHGHRQHFVGIPKKELLEQLKSLQLVLDEESKKKLDRLTPEERKIYDEDQTRLIKRRPWTTLLQTTADKRSVLGHYFGFIRLMEGKDTKLDLAMLYDAIRLKA